MKIAILGFAGQGQSAFEYWNNAGNEITVCDSDESVVVPEGASSQLGTSYLDNLDRFDLLIRTPSLHPSDIVAANPSSPDILNKVTTNTNEFFKVCPTKNIIGVTGTKGKGTTSTLITKILEAAVKTVHLGGNIGIAPLDMLKDDIQPDDWVVLELANFQLIDIKHSPHIAVCLMVVPEHLNWHADMDEYVTAKQQLFRYQKSDDIAIFNRNNGHSADIVAISLATKVSYEVPGPGAEPHNNTGAYLKGDTIYMDGTAICQASDVRLLGRHNLENVCAAIAATWELIGKNTALTKSVLSTFNGLPHRLELVRELNDVKYYDDSFGTTPETAIVAMQAFSTPKVIILGGADKRATYEELAHVVASDNVRQAILIGDTAPAIASALQTAGFTDYKIGGKTMPEIVNLAASVAQPGDIVLLSTGCASFGLFKDYKDRAEKFVSAVNQLPTHD
jgi:UDP-N-acetylmuramoylalanine--D-glutamate ligase